MEPDLFGELAIDVPVADVNVPIRLKTGLHVRQHVLWHPKIDSDAVTIPNLLLPGGKRSEQLPTMNPNSLALRTISTVTPPAGSPNSIVPSMSKLMRKANFVLLALLQ